MKKNSNPKLLGLLAFVVLLMGGGATYFQFQNVKAAESRVAALDAQVPTQKELQADLASTGTQLAAFQKQLAHLEKGVPDVAYVPTLMKELEQIGKAHHITVTGVRPAPQTFVPAATPEGAPKPKKKDYVEIEIEVKGRGNYDDIKAFMDALQQFPKVIAVKTISLSPQRDLSSRSKGEIEATVNIVTFVFPFEFVQSPAGSTPGTAPKPAGGETPAAGGKSAAAASSETMKLVNKGGQAHE